MLFFTSLCFVLTFLLWYDTLFLVKLPKKGFIFFMIREGQMKYQNNRLKELRKRLGLSQSELGKLLVSNQQTISRAEKDGKFTYELISRASRYFMVSSEYLLGLSDEKNTDIERQEPQPYQMMDEMSKTSIKKIANIITLEFVRRIEMVHKMYVDGVISLENACKYLECTPEQFKKYCNYLCQKSS